MNLQDLQENRNGVDRSLQFWHLQETDQFVWNSKPIDAAKVEMWLGGVYSEYRNYGPQVWMTGEGMEVIVGASSYEEAISKVKQSIPDFQKVQVTPLQDIAEQEESHYHGMHMRVQGVLSFDRLISSGVRVLKSMPATGWRTKTDMMKPSAIHKAEVLMDGLTVTVEYNDIMVRTLAFYLDPVAHPEVLPAIASRIERLGAKLFNGNKRVRA